MPFSDFNFYVVTSGDIEVFPLQDPDFDLVFTDQEDDDLGLYIRTLDSSLVFGGSDYDFLYDNYEVSGLCDQLPFRIDYKGSEYYTGTLDIGTDNLEWDRSNCRLIAQISPSGDYSCLRDGWENEFNMYDGVTEYPVETYYGTLTELTCGPVSAANPIEIMGYFETNVTACLAPALPSSYSLLRAYIVEVTPGVRYDHYATWITEATSTTCPGASPVPPPGDGWVITSFICPGTAFYIRPPALSYVGEQSAITGNY